jgi:hypothetical protein
MRKIVRRVLTLLVVLCVALSMAPRTALAYSSLTELYYGAGAIRSMTKLSNGNIVGGRSSGHEIEVWSSANNGSSWSRIGTVASNASIEYGDVMFLCLPGTTTVFCAFREKNQSNQYAVVVCKSTNGGVSWAYDSTVISGQSLFVGAPWLFIANNGDMQCYYDSEPLASQNGANGSQWIAMQGRNGTTGAWTKYGVKAASRDSVTSKFIRDGMPSVVNLGNNRIMVVTEGIENSPSGGASANVIRAIQSYDGGNTWDYAGRKIVYQSSIHSGSGRRYNAYCAMAIRVGNGPVGVLFCTDEDFGGTPDPSNMDVYDRRSHIKYIQTTTNFETWGLKTSIWTGGSHSYAPGMIETSTNNVLISIDNFLGNQRFYKMIP